MPEAGRPGLPALGDTGEVLVPPHEMSAGLRGAYEHVVDDHVRREGDSPESEAAWPVGWVAAAGCTWLVVLLLLSNPPQFLALPASRSFEPPPELRAASLQYGMWLARARIERFAHGASRLPSYLGEAGVDDSAITMTVTGEHRWELDGKDGDLQLRLTSSMAADSFLGGSLDSLVSSRSYQQAGVPGRTTAR